MLKIFWTKQKTKYIYEGTNLIQCRKLMFRLSKVPVQICTKQLILSKPVVSEITILLKNEQCFKWRIGSDLQCWIKNNLSFFSSYYFFFIPWSKSSFSSSACWARNTLVHMLSVLWWWSRGVVLHWYTLSVYLQDLSCSVF